MLLALETRLWTSCSLDQPLVVQDIVLSASPRIAFRVTGTPEAGPQLRPIQFSTTLSTLEAERGAYELRVRGWRKYHLLDVSCASATSPAPLQAWHVATLTHMSPVTLPTLCSQTVMTLLVD